MATMIRRTRPAEAPAEAPRRLMRVTRPAREVENNTKAMATLENHLKLLELHQNRMDYLRASIQPEILTIQAEMHRLEGVVEQDLIATKKGGYTNGAWECKFVTPMTREIREPDIAKIKKAMKPEEFLQVIKIQITSLKKFMTEREIDALSKVTPAVAGERQFVVGPAAVKKGKEK